MARRAVQRRRVAPASAEGRVAPAPGDVEGGPLAPADDQFVDIGVQDARGAPKKPVPHEVQERRLEELPVVHALLEVPRTPGEGDVQNLGHGIAGDGPHRGEEFLPRVGRAPVVRDERGVRAMLALVEEQPVPDPVEALVAQHRVDDAPPVERSGFPRRDGETHGAEGRQHEPDRGGCGPAPGQVDALEAAEDPAARQGNRLPVDLDPRLGQQRPEVEGAGQVETHPSRHRHGPVDERPVVVELPARMGGVLGPGRQVAAEWAILGQAPACQAVDHRRSGSAPRSSTRPRAISISSRIHQMKK